MTNNHHSSSESAAPSTPTFAGPIRRLMAVMYDSLLLLGILFVATLIPALVTGLLKPQQDEKIYDLPPLFQGAGFSLYLFIIALFFFSYFWRKTGQTLGMQAWRLKVIDVNGGVPSWTQCFVRGITAIFSLLLGGLGYWWVLFDKDKCAWQDRTSNTRVILLPKPKKK